MKWSMWLPLLAAATCSLAHVVRSPGPIEKIQYGRSIGTSDASFSQLAKRTEPAKCTPVMYSGDSNTKRAVPFGDHIEFADDPVRRMTLWRRTMNVPGPDENMDTWMTEELSKDSNRPIIWQRKKNGQPEDMATSAYTEFSVEKEAFSMGTAGLCGCTVVIIVSRQAVYIGHYWESISFWTNEEWLKSKGGPFKDQDDAFQKTVIKGLTEGARAGKEQVMLKGKDKWLNDDYTQAYLMIPNKNSAGKADPYRDQWKQMIEKMGEFVPKLTEKNGDGTWKRIHEHPYTPLPDDPRLDTTSAGKILFKYDPDEDGDGKGKKRTAIWQEGNKTPIHNDVWT